MGKLLRILVVFSLVLSIVALALGHMLFQKRELLKGRTQKLEKTIKALDFVIEAEPGVLERSPDFPARDVSECSGEVLASPMLSDFWEKYTADLEVQDPQSMLDTSSRDYELKSFYQRNPVTRKIEKDPVTGGNKTTGDGTMQSVLANVIAKATEQYDRLNKTRFQLVTVREELIDTINELNRRKGRLREVLNEFDELKAEIQRLNGEIRRLEGEIDELEEQKRLFEEKVTEMEGQVALLQEENENLKREIQILKVENDKLRKEMVSVDGPIVPVIQSVEHGNKGTVAGVNPNWNYVILRLNESFLYEILGEDLSDPVPNIDLLVKRQGAEESFVAKVRLIQVRKDKKMGIADILDGWQVLQIRQGDIVFY